jgi:hypothetical protein
MNEERAMGRRTCALFVDFDNLYSGLRAQSLGAAEEFATNPGRWLAWLRHGVGAGADLAQRRVVHLVCFLNPRAFGRYRDSFVRAGFTVVDCPPLTARNKNAADIHMVIAMLDALNHPAPFDEFILMTGDADFLPVVARLRSYNRFTLAIAGGAVAPCYRAACDRLVDADTFVQEALGIAVECGSSNGSGGKEWPEVLDRMAERVAGAAGRDGVLRPRDLPPLFKDFPEFTSNANWLGFGTLRRLTEELTRRNPRLVIVNGAAWEVRVRQPEEPQLVGGCPSTTDTAAVPDRVKEIVRRLVLSSANPVVMAAAAHAVLAVFPDARQREWFGMGRFKDLLMSIEDLGLEIASHPLPGYLYDPVRHRLPGDGKAA